MNTKYALLIAPLFCTGSLFAQTPSDDASNYTSWTDGSNEGTGFAAWSLNENSDDTVTPELFAGHFLGDSTAGAGDLNTGGAGGQSFGMFANPGGAFSTATRSFSSPLAVNDQFSFQMGVNFDNGNKGFNLRTAGDSIFNFNVGGGGSVSSPKTGTTLNPGMGAGYNFGGKALIDVVLQVISSGSITYKISRSSEQGFQGNLFTGTVTGITLASIDNFEFYISDTDAGGDPANNLYFNNLSVSAVPEPGTYALLFGCTAFLWVALRRRES